MGSTGDWTAGDHDDVQEDIMEGIKDAVKNLRLTDYLDQGRRAYKMGIEDRNNPVNSPSGRVLWQRGYDLEREKFQTMLQRWKS